MKSSGLVFCCKIAGHRNDLKQNPMPNILAFFHPICQITKNLPRTYKTRPRACQEPYRSTTVPTHLPTFTRHNLQNKPQPAKIQMRGRRCLRCMASSMNVDILLLNDLLYLHPTYATRQYVSNNSFVLIRRMQRDVMKVIIPADNVSNDCRR